MNMLLVHRYFWPDTPPYAAMLRHLGEAWSSSGHKISVFSAQPSYKSKVETSSRPTREILGNLEIYRARLPFSGDHGAVRRSVNTLFFLAQLAWYIASSRKLELVVMSTVPQVFGPRIASLVARMRGARFVYHIQDIHPESLYAVGRLSQGIVFRFLQRLDTATCRAASQVIVLSEDMRSTLIARDSLLSGKISVIKNPVMRDFDSASPVVSDDLLSSNGRTRFMFAGNIGRFQDLGSVVEAALGLTDSDLIETVLVGEGAAKKDLESLVADSGSSQIRFIPHQTVAVADALIAAADVALITLSPGVAMTAFPSKIINYTKAGTALLVAVEEESELAKIVHKHDLGIAVPNGDPIALREAMRALSKAPDRIARCSENAKQYFAETFDDERILADWELALESPSIRAVKHDI